MAPGRTLRDVASNRGLRKLVKYSMVSLVSVIVSQAALLIAFKVTHHGVGSNVFAVAVGTVPSYELNRRWTWRKAGPSHLWREIVPFWVMSFIGLVVSTVAVGLAERYAVDRGWSTGRTQVMVQTANLAAFGVLWVAKFLIINKLLFVHRPSTDRSDDLTLV